MSSVPIRPWTKVRLSKARIPTARIASQAVSPAARTIRYEGAQRGHPADQAREPPGDPVVAEERHRHGDQQLAERRMLRVGVEAGAVNPS